MSASNIPPTHEDLVRFLHLAQHSMLEVQRLDRALYAQVRFSKRISSALRTIGGLLDDAEIMQRCSAESDDRL
jgi:hypothetical protein